MKQMKKFTLAIVTMLLVSLGAFAGGDATVIYKLDGVASSANVVGTVAYANGTITVTPNNGYYLEAADLTVYKMINGQYAQGRRREPAYNTPVEVTASGTNDDPSKTTTYTITVPGDEYDYEITANFHQRISVENATVTGLEESYTYTGTAIKPVVTVEVGGKKLTLNTDYKAFYSDSINASTDQVKGKITLYGLRKYMGSKIVEYTIAKADPTLTFSPATATYTFGQESEFVKPTLTTTPEGLAVTYTSSNDNVAVIDEASGDITPMAASSEAITITASFAGNDNYNAKDATYSLTVAKGTAVVTKAPTAKTLIFTGENQELINAGEATNGEMVYKLGTDGEYSQTIPTGNAVGEYTIYYKASATNAQQYDDSEEAYITVTVGVKSIADATITLTPESFTYNGENQKPEVSVKDGETSLVLDTDYTLTNEGGTDVGEYTITITGKGDYSGSKSTTFTIEKAAGSISYATATVDKTFGDEPFVNELTLTGDGTVTYGSSNEDVATVDANGQVTIKGSGDATITATVADKDSGNYTYENKTATYTINVATATMNVTAAGFEGTYDGQPHNITVTAPEDATIKYSTREDTYDLDACPTYTDAGTYTVYYQVTKDNFTTVTGSKTVTISKAAGTISYATATVDKTFGDEPFVNELTLTGDGTVTYGSSNEDVATVDANGQVTIKGSGDATITATVADKDSGNYTYENKTATYTINVATATMNVTAAGYEGTYDGQPHTIIVTAPEDATIKYSTTGGTYDLDDSPTYTNAGTYTVYYQVTKDNFITITGSQTVTISKAAGAISYATATVDKTFGDEPFVNELTITGDGTVTYDSSNEDAATVDANGQVTIKGSGETTIKATVADKDGGNYTYENKTATYLLSVNTEAMEVSATAYTGTYDGQPHTIIVTAPEDATIKYSTTGGTYDLDDSPTYTNAGTYTVYYQVTKDNFTTITGSQTVTISKAAGAISYATATVDKTFGDEPFVNELTITGDGTVTYGSSDENVATVDETTGKVIIKGSGDATITATVADKEGGNYTYENKTATYTINVASAAMNVTVSGFTGTYDGQAHSISVTVTSPEGATVKYGTTEETYDLYASPIYTDAGTYTVYYQVTKAGYTTSKGSAIITIAKAASTVTNAPEAITGLTANGTEQTLITAGDANGGTMHYSTDGVNYSTGLPTGTDAGTYTIYYMVVGDVNHNDTEPVSINVTISRAMGEGYPLWINDTQVTADNAEDILGHDDNPEIPLYIFNKEKNQLLVNNDQTKTTVIESRMPELRIYLMDVSKIDHIFFNNVGNASNTGTLTFTCNGNFPGKLILDNSTKGESTITGFSDIEYEWNLVALEPDESYYDTETLEMKYKEKNEDGNYTGNTPNADNLTIGQVIVPMTEKKTITFEESQLVEKDADGKEKLDENGNPISADLSNFSYAPSSKTGEPEKNVILINLNPNNIGEDAGGYGEENGIGGIYIVDTMTDDEAGEVAKDVDNQQMVPGGSTYANIYDGFTFMIPAGEGFIEIDEIAEDGYEFHLRIGTGAPITLDESNSIVSRHDATSQRVRAELYFNVTEPVYCYLYLVKIDKASGARSIVPIGRRDKAHGKLISVTVNVSKPKQTNPPSEASGGIIPADKDPEIIVSGIAVIRNDRINNDRWYNLNGQQIDEPTKKGLYIRNGKKIYIK